MIMRGRVTKSWSILFHLLPIQYGSGFSWKALHDWNIHKKIHDNHFPCKNCWLQIIFCCLKSWFGEGRGESRFPTLDTMKKIIFSVGSEKNPGCLRYIGDYTIQLYGDYNKPLQGSLLNNQLGKILDKNLRTPQLPMMWMCPWAERRLERRRFQVDWSWSWGKAPVSHS